MAGAVDEHELAPRRVEVAIGDIDGDPLLALGAQPVGDKRDIGVRVATLSARALDRAELVAIDRARVDEQPTDERALAVVDGPDGREVEEIGGRDRHQK